MSNTPPPAVPLAPATPYHMPIRGTNRAPTFDGNGEDLLRFFEDVNDHADLARLPDIDRICWAIWYANVQDAETWKLLPSYTARISFEDFKDEVIELYPDIDSDRKYTVGDLERLVEEYQQKKILSKETLGEYHQNFIRILLFLIGRYRISSRERN
jgi:hypothetical protein